MSTGLELIPIALAVGAIVQARRERQKSISGASVTDLETRLHDEELLTAAIDAVAERIDLGDGRLYADVGGTLLAFEKGQSGTFEASFDSDVALDEAERALGLLDNEYVRQLQERTYRTLLERAPQEGLAVESRRVEGEDIVLTLRVEAV